MKKGLIEIIDIINFEDGTVKCAILIDSKPENIIMSFSSNVVRFITDDRCDALVMGLLLFAIRNNFDIHSNLPISETLFYKLTHHFIPGICANRVYQPKIIASITPDLDCYGEIIATGVSCGIDSLYTIMEHTQDVSNSFCLNHLVFLDAGAHHLGSKDKWTELYEGRRNNAIEFSKYVNLPLIEITTNLPEILEKYSEYNHIENNTYMMLSCLIMIQQGIKKYYYSAGYPYESFNCNITPDNILDSEHYDLLILWVASNSNIEFYSTGGGKNRFEKVKALKDYEPGKQFLNVCVSSVNNCGQCFKCKRTLLELDAVGAIDSYGKVFDIGTYKVERFRRIKEGYRGAIKGNEFLAELMPFFKAELSPMTRMLQKGRIQCGKFISWFR